MHQECVGNIFRGVHLKLLPFACTWYSLGSQKLTPADEGDNNKVSDCDPPKHNDELLKHEHSLSPHPAHRGKSEVLDEQRHDGTANLCLGAIYSHQEEQQHTKQGNRQLYVELAGITLAQFPAYVK